MLVDVNLKEAERNRDREILRKADNENYLDSSSSSSAQARMPSCKACHTGRKQLLDLEKTVKKENRVWTRMRMRA